jgi:hypothetical protein
MVDKGARVAIIDLDQPRAPKLSGAQAITVTGDVPRLPEMSQAYAMSEVAVEQLGTWPAR